jgi:undecaprenyl-diphosphatase
MPELIKALILGILEGITEFLPVSSTGHLILANQFIAFSESFTAKFDVIIQLGAILAVALVYWRRLIPNRTTPFTKSVSTWSRVLIAVIPALVIGALFHNTIESVLFNPLVVAIALIFWGVVLIIIESIKLPARTNSIESMSFRNAFLVGILQCLAMIPGTSRSAASIIGAMLLGASRICAVEFSFFLAIPTMVAASAYSAFKLGLNLTSAEISVLAVGFITSFLIALLVIRIFIRFISTNNFKVFGYYRILLGIAVLLYFYALR